jgi:hypothetical protein
MVNGIPVLYSKPATNSVYPGGSTEGLDSWIQPAGVGLNREVMSEWEAAVRALDDPEAYATRSAQSRAHIEAMNLFEEGQRIAELVEGFSRQYPAVKRVETAAKGAESGQMQQLPSNPAIPREPRGPAGFGFSNGRLRIQR